MIKTNIQDKIDHYLRQLSNDSGYYSALKKFIQQSFKYPLLSEEEEKKLLRLYSQKKDNAAYNKLLLSHLRLVISITLQYGRKSQVNIYDLIQQGTLGLCIALKNFDLKKNTRFSTYARFWIKSYILHYIRENYSLYRIAQGRVEQRIFFALHKTRETLRKEGKNSNDFKHLGYLLNADEKIVEDLVQKMDRKVISLDQPVHTDIEQPLYQLLPSDEKNLEQTMIKKDLDNCLQQKFSSFSRYLNQNQKEIWEKRIIAERPLSLYKIGDSLNLTGERIRQIEKEIKEKLKVFLEKQPDFSVSDYLN